MRSGRHRPAQRPSLPPARSSAKSQRRRDKPRRRDPLWAKLCVIFGVLMAVTSGTILGGGKLLAARVEGSVHRADLLGDNGRKDISGAIDFLLLGSDSRAADPNDKNDARAQSLHRTDTIILAHIPKEHDRAFLISFQRDTKVQIPHCPNAPDGCEDKINAAYAFGEAESDAAGGARMLSQTLHDLIGINFNGAAVVDFHGFTKVTKELGGVVMCVDERVVSIHSGRVYEKGCRPFDEHAALDYVRQRYGLKDGDFGRMRNQQKFIKALLTRAAQQGVTKDPRKLDRVIQAAGASITLSTNGVATDDLMFSLRNIRPENLVSIRVPTRSEKIAGTDFQILEERSQALFESIRNDKVDEWVTQNSDVINPIV